MTKLLIYSVVTMIVIILSLYFCNKKHIETNTKDKILKVFVILTVIIHYSSLWIEYLTTGTAEVENTMLFPIYPCNICMWMLVIVAFMKDKKSRLFKILAEFLAIGGTVCGMVGLFANEIFLSNPKFLEYDSLKGLLSHSTMIFSTLFLLTQGYVKIRTISICVSTLVGLAIFVIDGFIINTLFAIFNLPEVNAMYMLYFPFDIEGMNFVILGVIGMIVVFIGTSIYEVITLKPSDRWYNKLHKQKELEEIKQE